MSDDKPMTPEEALAKIKAIAAEGKITYGSDSLTAEYDDEIQRIFVAVRRALLGKEPPRGFWTQDGERIRNVLDKVAPGVCSPASIAACETASRELGITITPDTIWEEAGAALRSLDPTRVRS